MNNEAQIKRGMALAFFASAYADLCDDHGEPLRGEIMDQLPDEMDPGATAAADTLAQGLGIISGKVCRLIGLESLYAIVEAMDSEGADRELSPELFGHYCAMQAMGHGVGLESFGHEVRGAVRVPYVEFSQFDLEHEYF